MVNPANLKKRNLLGLEVLEIPGDPQAATIVLFHGYGADAYDLVSLSKVYQGQPRPTWIFPNGHLKVSLGHGYEGRAWFPVNFQALQEAMQTRSPENIANAFPPELSEVRQLGKQLIAELNIPLSKLFIGGFSQGAVLATEIALDAFTSVAGLLVLSGTLIHENRWRQLAEMHSGMHFFQSHGDQDPLLPLSRAQSLEALFKSAGMQGKLHVFHGGHEIPYSVLGFLGEFFAKFLS